ncbi:MAG: glycosyltransferase family 39 protein [Rubrobacter sp.]|nr:glycosyltransferase family 39 protein [Rubrobacter sp.]
MISSKRIPLSERMRTVAAMKTSSWQRLTLVAILLLSAFLNLFKLTEAGYGNSYYAAAVKDMLTSWHNFFFVSFDAGFVSVDKPPLGLWIQAASAYLFGFSGLSLLLPQAIAGVLCVALLYHLLSRVFGPVAGLMAALALAITPVAVGVERTNNADGLLTLTVLVAAWAVIRAVESGRLRWLLVGAVVVGLGFNMKMLEAYLVLPALYLFYLVASSASWRRRFIHLGAATVVLLGVSLSWAVAVDLTPAEQRPYVGSSSNNSALDLALGYNGLERLLGREGAPGGESEGQSAQENNAQEGPTPSGGFGPGGARENGEAGPLRLLDTQLAGQIGWLLPLAVVGLLAASWQNRPQLPINQQPPQGLRLWRRWFLRVVSFLKNLPQLSLDQRQGALVLWGMWLLTMAVFFSVAGMFHRYYMVMLAPAVAALVGVGVVALWSDYRRVGWRGWLLPLTLLGMAALHTYIILAHYDEDWTPWLPPVIAGLCLFTVGVLVAGRLLRPRRPNNTQGSSPAYLAGVVALGVLALLIAPMAWTSYTVWQGGGRGLAGAGPRPVQQEEEGYGGPGGPPGGGGPGGPNSSNADTTLMDYLQANRADAKYLVGTINSMSASPIILSTDEPAPVITLGGFSGRDPVLSTDRISGLVDEGTVRFFLIPDRERMEQIRAEREESGEASQGPPPGGPMGAQNNEATSWVEDNCKKVPQEEWQSPEDEEEQGGGGPMGRAQALYDCDPGSSQQ